MIGFIVIARGLGDEDWGNTVENSDGYGIVPEIGTLVDSGN